MLRARLHALLALSFLNFGSIGDAAGEVPRAIAAARHAQDPAAEVLAVACNSTISWYQGKLDRARSISAGAIALADQAYPAGRELWTPEIWHVMVLSSLGCDQEAIGMADAGVRHARQAGEPELLRYWVTTRSRLLLDAASSTTPGRRPKPRWPWPTTLARASGPRPPRSTRSAAWPC